MKLYISGPMSGIEDFNYPAFHTAKQALTAAGYEVISPADLPIREDWEWIDYIEVDIGSVFRVDGLAMLTGWAGSKGARIERAIAECRGLSIAPVIDWLELAGHAVPPELVPAS